MINYSVFDIYDPRYGQINKFSEKSNECIGVNLPARRVMGTRSKCKLKRIYHEWNWRQHPVDQMLWILGPIKLLHKSFLALSESHHLIRDSKRNLWIIKRRKKWSVFNFCEHRAWAGTGCPFHTNDSSVFFFFRRSTFLIEHTHESREWKSDCSLNSKTQFSWVRCVNSWNFHWHSAPLL